MTRQINASDLLGSRRSRVRARPQAGTKLGDAYDALRRGERVHQTHARITSDLRDYYGLELKTVRGPGGYIALVGEWDGAEFVPLERILQEDMERAA